jgi:hypothetical protein
MYKELHDNDIVDLLAKTSTELAPSEASLSKLLSVLHTTPLRATPSKRAPRIQTMRSARAVPSSSPYMRFIGAFGGVVAICFLYFGVTGTSVLPIPAANVPQGTQGSVEFASTAPLQATTQTTTSAPATIAAKKASTSEVTELGTLLETELAAEVTADTSLLALSDTI